MTHYLSVWGGLLCGLVALLGACAPMGNDRRSDLRGGEAYGHMEPLLAGNLRTLSNGELAWDEGY